MVMKNRKNSLEKKKKKPKKDEDEESFDDYVKRLRCFGEWGDNTELYAAAQCYQVDIYIHQADTPMYMIGGGNPSSSSGSGSGSKCIHLSYHGECHYNSVVPTNQQQASRSHHLPVGNDEKITSCTAKNNTSSHKPSQQDIDVVAGAVPWVEDDCIRQALQKTVGNIDEAIELLCSGFMQLEVKFTDKNTAVAELDSQFKAITDKVNTTNQQDLGKSQDHCQDEQTKKDKQSKGGKAKKNVVLSKKEQRKLEKQSLANKDSKDIPSIVDIHSPSPSFQNVIVI
eukprot:scaffold416_cov161-Ochromonas_danica.AAC.8